MNKLVLVFVFLILTSFYAKSQTLEWLKYSESKDYTSARCLETDMDGNIYFSINSSDSSLFLVDTLYSMYDNVHIYKLDRNGNKIWRKDAISSSFTSISGLTIDVNNNVYVFGNSGRDTIFIDGQEFIPNDTLNNSFIWKMDENGVLVFFKFFLGVGNYFQDIEVDSQQNIYMSGNYENTLFLDDTVLYSSIKDTFPYISYCRNAFVAKFNSIGGLLNVNVFPGGASGWIATILRDIVLDSYGSIYALGTFRDSMEINGQWIYSSGNSDMILMKLSNDCKVLWTKKDISPDAGISTSDIEIDKYGGIYITGGYYAQTSFDTITVNPIYSSYSDAFLVKYDSTGNAVWSQTLGSNNYVCEGRDIELTQNGDLFWTGTYADSSIISDTILETFTSNYYDLHTFISKISLDGDFINVFTLNSESSIIPYKLAVSQRDTLHILGYYDDNIIFNDTIRDSQYEMNDHDIFLMKFSFETKLSNIYKSLIASDIKTQYYPNPTSGNLILKNLQGHGEIRLINNLGQIIMTESYHDQTKTVSMSSLSPGIYIINIIGGTNSSIKVIKQ